MRSRGKKKRKGRDSATNNATKEARRCSVFGGGGSEAVEDYRRIFADKGREKKTSGRKGEFGNATWAERPKYRGEKVFFPLRSESKRRQGSGSINPGALSLPSSRSISPPAAATDGGKSCFPHPRFPLICLPESRRRRRVANKYGGKRLSGFAIYTMERVRKGERGSKRSDRQ